MFFLNVGYKWTLVEEARNGVILPSGNDIERVRRVSMPEFKRVLFDPQLYLAELPAADCAKVCARLGSYPWFGVELPGFESSSMRRREWQQLTQAAVANAWTGQPPNDPEYAVRSAIEFQTNIGCTHVICPRL